MDNYELNLEKVLEIFDLGKTLVEPESIYSMSNTNYLVTTEKGQFVVRFLRNETHASVINGDAIYKHLKKFHLISPEYVRKDNGDLTDVIEGTLVCVEKKVLGQVIEKVDAEFCKKCGELLAKFHLFVGNLPEENTGWLDKESTEVPLRSSSTTKKAVTLVKQNQKIYSTNLPTGIIHGDVHEGNVLVDLNNEISAIIDFDESEYNILLVDVARSIIDLGDPEEKGELNTELVQAFLKGYNSNRPLTEDEKTYFEEALKYAAGKCAIWLCNRNYEGEAARYITIAENFTNTWNMIKEKI